MQTMPSKAAGRAPLYPAWRERYQVVGKVGAGGSADVYEAVDLERDEEVALKVVDERAATGRVLREVEAAQTLEHPNIVALLDFFGDGRRSFLVWELVRGQSLAELVGTLADDEAVLAVSQLYDALAYAHSCGVVHRDVKPQNVMIDQRGVVKVMDFGIARLADADTLTAEGELLGTVAYMSPEQAAGRRVAPPSDVYSAAVLLYELLAGESPVRGATAGETVSNILAGRIAPLGQLRPDLPAELTDAIGAACSLRPGDRPTAAEMAGTLRELAGRLGGRRLSPQRLLAPLRRLDVAVERGLGALLAAVAVALLTGGLPAYPPSWRLPLAVLTAVAWLAAPRFGLAFALGALAFPLFNVSASIGVVYLLLAIAAFLAFRRRPLLFVWPALAVLLAPVYGTLLAPCAAAAFGRRRGALVAAWSGVAAGLLFAVTAAQRSPFAGYAAPGHAALRLRHAADPVVVVTQLWRLVSAWPTVTQAVLWAGLAFALAAALRRDRLEARLWIWAGAFSLFYLLERVLPVSLWHLPAAPRVLLLNTVVAAVVSGVALALLPGATQPAPEVLDDPAWDPASDQA